MDTEDRPTFDTAFKRLALAFRLRMRADDLDELCTTYFVMLKGYPLHDVVAAGNSCIRQHRTFPKPADWLDRLTRSDIGAPADVRVMSTVEATSWCRAERLHWDDEPCTCLVCQAIGIVQRQRFVPDFDDQDREERAFCPPKNRTVVVGHWAHGAELERWHVARRTFFGAAGAAGVHAKVLRRLGFIYTPPAHAPRLQLVEREPGEEG